MVKDLKQAKIIKELLLDFNPEGILPGNGKSSGKYLLINWFYYFRWQEQPKDNPETNFVQEQSGNSSQVFDGESKFGNSFITIIILKRI